MGDGVGIVEGELARKPELGEGCGSMEGEGLMLGGRDGGEAKLNEVAGDEPKL